MNVYKEVCGLISGIAVRLATAALLACLATVGLLAACDGDVVLPFHTPTVIVKEATGTMTHSDVPLTPERLHEVRLKYDDLFWRQPNVWGVAEGSFSDGSGGFTDTIGIVILVTTKVEQSTLPISDRIPAFLEGVPVQIEERNPPRSFPSPREDADD